MVQFSEQFLDELRQRLPVSEVVRSRVALSKAGHEWKGLSPFNKENSPSFTVNDSKGIWSDFSAGKAGDIFEFLIQCEGLSFPEAVARCATQAGIPLPDGRRPAQGRLDNSGDERRGMANGHDRGAKSTDSGMDGADVQPESGERDRREIAATFDYTDADGSLLYQAVRWQWKRPDGSWALAKTGKPKKTFSQRRPIDGEPGKWIWGLQGGTYVRMRNGDFVLDSNERSDWNGERREFDDCAHTLYRMPELREETMQAPGDRRTVFLAEGEMKVDAHTAWDMVATCNSGGAHHWQPHFAEYLRDCDVVIEADNDGPGRDGADKKAKAMQGVAARVRVLDWGAAWAACPAKGDVVDFAAHGGTRDRLFEIVDGLKDWQEPPYSSKFGLVMWAEQDLPGERFEYLVEDLIPEAEPVLIYGETQSGKSFWTFDLAMAGARGIPFFGRRILNPFGVVYCAYEAGKGFRNRMRAYRKAHGLDLDELPFALLTYPIDLWSDEQNVQKLIDEIGEVARRGFNGAGLKAIVIDTHNAATPGASEIDSEVVSLIRERYRALGKALDAGVWIVSHKNASGKHRGNEQLYNNIDTAIDIAKQTRIENKKSVPIRDAKNRIIRIAEIVKQREGETAVLCNFGLAIVESGGMNKFGKPFTSCVVERSATGDDGQSEVDTLRGQEAARDPGAMRLTDEDVVFFRALLKAIAELGKAPPPDLHLPRSITAVVTTTEFGTIYRSMMPNDEGQDEKGLATYEAKIKARVRTARTKLSNRRAIGVLQAPGAGGQYLIWPTGRRVVGPGLVWPATDATRAPEPEPIPADHATGERIESIDENPY